MSMLPGKINAILLCAGSALIMLSSSSCKSKAASYNSDKVATELVIPPLFERTGELAKADEWVKTKEKVIELNKKISQSSADLKSRLQLATIYMNEARITGEHPYYYPAILKILDGVLALDANNFEALVYKASVKMSLHRFSEAKQLAEKARVNNPDNAYVYGVLVDANVELGNYEEAVRLSDKMQSLKPSLESYSRVSYLREIYGDYPGAIEAMKLAVQAGIPGSEPWCWTKKTLGHLYEMTDQWKEADQQYSDILITRPSYAFALEGLARVAKERKEYTQALELLDRAIAIMPEFSFCEEKAAIYELQGDTKKAEAEYGRVLSMLKEDEAAGHAVALEMCQVYTKTGQWDLALAEAMKEFRERPYNIDVNHALAWASFQKNDTEQARKYLETALRTGSKDPELLERANLIKKRG
jgi:tetratricopeptide (TPR) repeat protein